MMKKLNLNIVVILFLMTVLRAQTNFSFTNPDFEKYLKGDFDPTAFDKRNIAADMNVSEYIKNKISTDSLSEYLRAIISFNNRNTINDTLTEPNKGIRGARNYIQTMLDYWNSAKDGVILSSEFQFDYLMCNRIRHSELLSFIPGNGPQKDEMVIIEAHLDSRCEDRCDIQCLAQGAEDNGSGSSLIMELARLLSKVNLNRSIIILWVTGEEQGLGGSRSFAVYCKNNNIKIKAVFNNDIVGGIECGKTSSPPSCPGPYQYDSVHFRIFSAGVSNSMHKNLARLVKLFFDKNLSIPNSTILDVMYAEDRTGRGSDHIPFRENGFTSIRFTSSYEHGDGNPDQAGYEDRQHSTRDILGKDLNGDGILDSLYVDFTYLAHNTFVNAIASINSSSSTIPSPNISVSANNKVTNIQILNPSLQATGYYVGFRKVSSAYFDTIFYSSQPDFQITGLLPGLYYISATAVDSNRWMSMIGQEVQLRITDQVENINSAKQVIELFQNIPNPFDEQTLIPVMVYDQSKIVEAKLILYNSQGIEVKKMKVDLKEGLNEILLDLPYYKGNQDYYYSLVINGKTWKTLPMKSINY